MSKRLCAAGENDLWSLRSNKNNNNKDNSSSISDDDEDDDDDDVDDVDDVEVEVSVNVNVNVNVSHYPRLYDISSLLGPGKNNLNQLCVPVVIAS